MQCVILAGGLGTRVQELHPDVPKTLFPVAGRPFASWQLDWLADQGVSRIVYSIGHLGHQVRDFVGNGSRWGVSVNYAEEPAELRGTAGALRLAIDDNLVDPEFFVLYGDSYLTVALADVERAFHQTPAPALMTVLRNEGRWDTSNAVLEDRLVVRYEKSLPNPPPEMRWIDYGLSLVTRDVILQNVPEGRGSDLAELYATLSRRRDLAGYEVMDRFYEIGSPQGLADLELRLSTQPPS